MGILGKGLIALANPKPEVPPLWGGGDQAERVSGFTAHK